MIKILNNLLNTMRRPAVASCTLLGTLFSGLTFCAQAQEETSYLYDKYSMKHYGTSQMNFGSSHAMAGTLFDYDGIPGNNAIHLLADPSPFSTGIVYDDVDYDERLIGVHYNRNAFIVMVTTLGNYAGRGPANGIQIINHTECDRQYIFAPADFDYWPMGSLMDDVHNAVYICGYVTPLQRVGVFPDYTTPKQAFVMRYDVGGRLVTNVNVYDWPVMSPSGRDYDMAHRMKYKNDGNIWVGGICNGAMGSAMMNMVIDPVTLMPLSDNPLNTGLATEDHVATSFDISDNLAGKGYSYIYGNYFYPKSSAVSLFPQPGNYSITAVDAGTLKPVTGAQSHAYFNAFDHAWGTNIVYGNKEDAVVLSGYQDAENSGSTIPSSVDNINPFLTEVALDAPAGNIVVTHTQWATMLSAAGTGIAPAMKSFYNLGGGPSNLVFGPITTVRDLFGGSDDIVLNAPVWNNVTGSDLNIKYIRTDRYLDPKCEIARCIPKYKLFDVKISEKVRVARFGHASSTTTICPVDLTPIAVLDCAGTGYFKGANTTEVGGNATDALVAVIYPNPAHDMIQVKLSGKLDAAAGITIQLADITGRQLSVLYTGPVSGMMAVMKLPEQLPNGLYTVNITCNGTRLKSVPLVIN